jgi:NAD(P)-dependent dehydrogenase (short-subunit alcohol dehydrogenase family)
MSLLGKIAIVTGGGSGIGEAVSQELARRGATVVVADINSGDASRVAEAIARQGGRAEARQVDVSSEDDVRQMVEETAASHGRLDYLFKQRRHRHRGRCPRPDLRALAPGTRRGPVRGHLRHARRLPNHDPAGIRPHRQHLVISRAAALTVQRPYNTSKHAVVGLSLSLRIEAADLG